MATRAMVNTYSAWSTSRLVSEGTLRWLFTIPHWSLFELMDSPDDTVSPQSRRDVLAM